MKYGVAVIIALVGLAPLRAQALPVGFTESRYVRGLQTPTSMAFSPDGRLFVNEQRGQVRVVKNGKLLAKPFLSVDTDDSGERGLLGIAFHPNFSENRYVYIYYTVPGSKVHNRVSRFTASRTNPDVVQAGSERVILNLGTLSAGNHNGGAIHFGPDGKLYIGVGDNARSALSQSITTRFGKILRLNDTGSIPVDNPFYQTARGSNRSIWARGLRNPYSFQFDPIGGKMYINDVGQNTWEEVNRGVRGANYGWPFCEGRCSRTGMKNPTFVYNHNGGSASITGGAFYRGTRFPSAYHGGYFFGDYIVDKIWWIDTKAKTRVFTTQAKSPVDIAIGPDGRLYYASIGEGAIYRISR